jgi:radical SAM protein with 4Fe4S-binding SPASM domain
LEQVVRGDCSVRIDGLGFSSEEIAACVERQGLLSLELELAAEKCACVGCGGTQAGLTAIEISDVVGQAKELGARRVILVNGERKLYPDLQELIETIRGMGLEVELFTHGAGVTSQYAKFLSDSDVHVVVGLDSMTRLVHDRRAGWDGAFDVAQECLANLMAAGYGGSGKRLAVRTAICEENFGELADLWRWVRGQGMTPYFQIITPENAKPEMSVVSAERAKDLYEELGRIDRVEFGQVWETEPALMGRSCKRPLFACHLTACGTVLPCVGLTIPIGNVRVDRLRQILSQSEVLENVRNFREKVKEPCKTCSQTTDCFGCRGAAYQLTGNYLAGDQLCWKAEGLEIDRLPAGVTDLIPHGPTVRVIDRLIKVGEREATAEFVVKKGSAFVDAAGRFDEAAYVEMIAQAFAATQGFHLTVEERPKHRGLLLGIKELTVSGDAFVGDRLLVHIRKLARFGAFGVVDGTVSHEDGRLIASGQVKVWRQGSAVLKAMAT